MIFLDDAGTGCFLGMSVIVIYDDVTKKNAFEFISNETQNDVMMASFSLLSQLKIKKNEPIKVCRGWWFDKFSRIATKLGYIIERVAIIGEAQEIVEGTFLKHLYSLGVSEQIILHEKDYKRFHFDLMEEVLLKPHLIQYIKQYWRNKIIIITLIKKVNKLHYEFPNLCNMLALEL